MSKLFIFVGGMLVRNLFSIICVCGDIFVLWSGCCVCCVMLLLILCVSWCLFCSFCRISGCSVCVCFFCLVDVLVLCDLGGLKVMMWGFVYIVCFVVGCIVGDGMFVVLVVVVVVVLVR